MISISSLIADTDVIPSENESIDVTVVVSATANENMTASSNFTVTLINPNYNVIIEETLVEVVEEIIPIDESIPYFSVLGNSTVIPALPIIMGKNETTLNFDLGKLLY